MFAVWNASSSNHCHALYACQCSLLIKANMAMLDPGGYSTARIAICTDEVLVGWIGMCVAWSPKPLPLF